MTERLIAIDPKKADDNFYRYKMPAIATKVEGNGNGIKTVFPNMHEICSRIKRPESIMLSFFQSELGAQKIANQKDDKFIVMGSHAQERMQEKVYSYIERFVLCKHCRNPETTVSVEAREKVMLTCRACGKASAVSPGEKVYSAFVQYYKNEANLKKEAAAAATAAPASAATVAPAAGSLTAAKPVQKSTVADERENPIDILSRELQKNPTGVEGHIRTVFELRSSYNLDDKLQIRLAFRAVVQENEANFMGSLLKNIAFITRFAIVKEKSSTSDEAIKMDLEKKEKTVQATLAGECESLSFKYGAFKMPIVLKMLYENGALLASSIHEWDAATKPQKGTTPEAFAEMKRLTEPLIKWLSD